MSADPAHHPGLCSDRCPCRSRPVLPVPTSGEHLRALARRAPGGHADPVLGMTVDDGAWQPVAVYPPAAGSGGEATVFVSRAPAMFYRITCPALGVDLSTGSGAHDLADGIAAALAAGMLGPTSKED